MALGSIVTPGSIAAMATVLFVVAIAFVVIWRRNKTRG